MFAWMHFFPGKKQLVAPQHSAPAPVEERAVPSASAAVASPVRAELAESLAPETRKTLANDFLELTVSSHGGALVTATLKEYPELNEVDSPALTLNFDSSPALRYAGLPLKGGALGEIDGGLVYTVPFAEGQVLRRTLQLVGDYALAVRDEFINSSDAPWMLPALRLPTGPMSNPAGTSSSRGMTTLGVDTHTAADGVTYWGRRFRKLGRGAQEYTSTPDAVQVQPVDWVAAKNKFFVQILTPISTASSGFDFTLRRSLKGKRLSVSEVVAALQFEAQSVAGHQTLVRDSRVYIGPKEFSVLKAQGMDQTDVMEFKSAGFWKFMNPVMYPVKRALLWGLVHFAPFGNYGIAILILTVIVRVIFWPLTHKGTESMKRMQELQPQIKEIQAKYKDNPQRMQQETMAFYRENKLNPMGGCLPMFIQVPVFIALFAVLRSAIELRFSKFLWIRDLSEPEHLFAGAIPFIGSLNILPLFMAATMMWQQKLTTATAAVTPEQQQQQKMMAVMMPIMMLFFFYSMPSGLVLYWTTSQVLMIVQMLVRKKKMDASA